MNEIEKKLIILKKDCEDDKILGEKQFIKFLDNDRKYAVFYRPLVAPRYLKCFIEENGYEIGYEIKDQKTLNENEDKVFTFVKKGDVYHVTKGIELERKRILLADTGMGLLLDLPKYKYEIEANGFRIEKMYEDDLERSYCYIANEDEISSELKKIMLPVVEVMPGFLSINSYPFVPDRSYKKRKKIR